MSDLDATISRCLDHVSRIELDSRLTVRQYPRRKGGWNS